MLLQEIPLQCDFLRKYHYILLYHKRLAVFNSLLLQDFFIFFYFITGKSIEKYVTAEDSIKVNAIITSSIELKLLLGLSLVLYGHGLRFIIQ